MEEWTKARGQTYSVPYSEGSRQYKHHPYPTSGSGLRAASLSLEEPYLNTPVQPFSALAQPTSRPHTGIRPMPVTKKDPLDVETLNPDDASKRMEFYRTWSTVAANIEDERSSHEQSFAPGSADCHRGAFGSG